MPRKRPFISPEQRRQIRAARIIREARTKMMRARLEDMTRQVAQSRQNGAP